MPEEPTFVYQTGIFPNIPFFFFFFFFYLKYWRHLFSKYNYIAVDLLQKFTFKVDSVARTIKTH